jgi:hypothetical protein
MRRATAERWSTAFDVVVDKRFSPIVEDGTRR